MPRGMLDGHVRPGAGDDERLDAEAAQDDVQLGVVEAVHPRLLEDEVALLGLQPVCRRSSPRAAHQGVAALDVTEERRVLLETRRTRLDDEVDVDDRNAQGPCTLGQRLDVLHEILALGVLPELRRTPRPLPP